MLNEQKQRFNKKSRIRGILISLSHFVDFFHKARDFACGAFFRHDFAGGFHDF